MFIVVLNLGPQDMKVTSFTNFYSELWVTIVVCSASWIRSMNHESQVLNLLTWYYTAQLVGPSRRRPNCWCQLWKIFQFGWYSSCHAVYRGSEISYFIVNKRSDGPPCTKVLPSQSPNSRRGGNHPPPPHFNGQLCFWWTRGLQTSADIITTAAATAVIGSSPVSNSPCYLRQSHQV